MWSAKRNEPGRCVAQNERVSYSDGITMSFCGPENADLSDAARQVVDGGGKLNVALT